MLVSCNSTILVSVTISLNRCFNFFGVVPNAATATCRDYFHWHIPNFLQFSFQIVITFILSFFLSSIMLSKEHAKLIVLHSILVLSISDLLAAMTWSFCIVNSHSKNHFLPLSLADGLYHFSFTSKPIFIHTSQCIFLPTQSGLLLYSLCANMGIHTRFVSLSHPRTFCYSSTYLQSAVTFVLSLVYFCLYCIYCICPNDLFLYCHN